ncbi:MAG: hypothetical protein IJ730_04425 [Alphaproteobacteria bacterium]|nr:hypothetical protein [Alphaproteobacteria bacterium]
MKKLATTVVLASLLGTILVDNADASIFTRKNKVTMATLQKAFGVNLVNEKYTGTEAKELYDNFVTAQKTYENILKTNKLTKDTNAKAFKDLLSKLKNALEDIYQSEKKSKLVSKASKAVTSFNANYNAYTNLKNTAGEDIFEDFEDQFNDLEIPELQENSNDEIVINTYYVFQILTQLQKIMGGDVSVNTPAVNTPVTQNTTIQTGATATTATPWMFQQTQTSGNTVQVPVQQPAVQQVQPVRQNRFSFIRR